MSQVTNAIKKILFFLEKTQQCDMYPTGTHQSFESISPLMVSPRPIRTGFTTFLFDREVSACQQTFLSLSACHTWLESWEN
jgi:hypothetical protein